VAPFHLFLLRATLTALCNESHKEPSPFSREAGVGCPWAFLARKEQPKLLTNADVVEMWRVGVPESTIILTIEKTPVKFDVSAE
jgi:hypothetical protein